MGFLTAPTGLRPFVSVGTKLASAMLLVLGVVTSFTYLEVSRNEREQLLAAKARAATMVTQLFAAGVTAPLSFSDEPGVKEHVALLLSNANVTCAAVWSVDPTQPDRPGERLAETIRGDFAARPAPARIPKAVEVERTASEVVVEHPVTSPSGEVLGVVRVGFSLQRENAAIAAAKQRTLVTALALGVGLGLVLLGLTRTLIVTRLARLAGAAKRLEDGDAGDIDIDTNDEVGHLARALASMSEAIASREAHISARNRDLRRVLDNVNEGLITVSTGGRMSDERSGVLDQWFGTPADPHHFFAYFERFAPTTARWLRIGWQALQDDFMPVEVVLDEMPRRFEHEGRSFELEYLPIWKGPESEQVLGEVLVVVRDVTSRVARERAEQAQREAMNVFRRLLDDRAGFREFSREATRLVDAIGSGTGDAADMPRVARDVHTLKGNAALYGIESIAQLCHAVESRLHEQGGPLAVEELAQIRAAWSTVRKLTEELDRSGTDERVDLSLDEYAAHLAELESRLPGDKLAATVRNWANELASHRLARVAEQGRSIARRLGKPDVVVDVRVTPPSLRLPAATWSPIWAAFAHILRNTFDHGIETTAERVGAGKSAGGRVEITLAARRGEIELRVADDGRGIAWERLRERAASLGLPHETAADLEEALYADRVSSRKTATETSGRGLGMGAVRDVVRDRGGSIAIETRAGHGTTLRIHLPLNMLESPRSSTFPTRAPRAA